MPPRHRTLRTAIGWSHELCTPEQRLLWARLSVFPGQFDLEAAEYICGGPELPSDSVLEVLEELLAQSLLVREDTPAGVRYRMLDTIRDYGARWLTATEDTERLRRRHRDWFLGLATWCELDWFSPRQAGIAARVDGELPNLRGALEFSLEHPEDVHLAQYLAGTLWFYWVGCGRLAEGRHWLDHVLRSEGGHDGARLKALWVLGYVAVLQGDSVAAVAALQECHEAAQHTGDAVAAAYALHRTGCLALVTDDMPRAEELLREAVGQYRDLGELNSNVLMGQVELAMAVCFRGRLAEAAAICQDVVAVCEDHGELWARAYALYVLAFEAWSDGRPARSRELLSDCLTTSHAFHDQLGTVLALELMALLTLERGEATEAALLQGAAGRLWASVGLPLFGSAYYSTPHQRCEEGARRKLGREVYESFLARGRGWGGTPPWSARCTAPRHAKTRRPCSARSEGTTGRSGEARGTSGSAGVVLDDQLLVADDRDFLAVRVAVQAEGQGLQVHLEVARGLALGVVATLTGDLEGDLLAAALADHHDVVGTDAERRLVDLAAVDLDVAVDDHLAGLVDGPGDARTQDQGVETTLELDDERLARLALGLLGAVVGAGHLALADVVLGAQTLLLEQTDLVVRVLLAATAVLARRVRTGLEVLDSLRRQRDTERA